MFTCYDSSTPYIRNLCWSLNTIRQSSESTFYTGKYKKRVNDWFGLRARNVGIRTGRVAQRMWKKQTRNSNKWTSLWSEVFFVLRVTSKPIGKTLENRMFVVAKNRDCPQFLIWIFSGEGGGKQSREYVNKISIHLPQQLFGDLDMSFTGWMKPMAHHCLWFPRADEELRRSTS